MQSLCNCAHRKHEKPPYSIYQAGSYWLMHSRSSLRVHKFSKKKTITKGKVDTYTANMRVSKSRVQEEMGEKDRLTWPERLHGPPRHDDHQSQEWWL